MINLSIAVPANVKTGNEFFEAIALAKKVSDIGDPKSCLQAYELLSRVAGLYEDSLIKAAHATVQDFVSTQIDDLLISLHASINAACEAKSKKTKKS